MYAAELLRPSNWSMDGPAWISAPSVFLPGTPVRNFVEAPAWAPPPGPGLRPVSTRVLVAEPLHRLEDRLVKSNPLPSLAGVQYSIAIPFGT